MTKTPTDRLLDEVAWEELPPNTRGADNLPFATHKGILKIGELELLCYVLDDGRRIFDGEQFREMFGLSSSGDRLRKEAKP